MNRKLRIIEKISSLVMCGVFLACILFIIFYNPQETMNDVVLGFDFSFIYYFKGSLWKSIIGILALLTILLFCGYCIIEMKKQKSKIFIPFYLLGIFVFILFANGYYNVIYKIDGLLVLLFILIFNLIVNVVLSFIIYINIIKGRK